MQVKQTDIEMTSDTKRYCVQRGKEIFEPEILFSNHKIYPIYLHTEMYIVFTVEPFI